jgi:hypothetical protein
MFAGFFWFLKDGGIEATYDFGFLAPLTATANERPL